MAQDEVSALVDRLVSIHGEAGVCPTAADWRTIFAVGGEGPIRIVNLLKFHAEVASPEGPIPGAAAYGKYSAGVRGAFQRAGGERIFFGQVGHMFAFGEAPGWDAVVVTRYPSARALAGMWLDPDFVAAHENRMDGLERSQVLVFSQ